MKPFIAFESAYVRLVVDHIDTDQIIPARFLKTTSREGLGQHAFADWRYDGDGRLRTDCPLNAPETRGASVLLAGENFGCGSSREHAPWALLDMGFRAIVAPSFGEIFQNNALKNGLVPIRVDTDAHAELAAAPANATIGIDLGVLRLPGGRRVEYPLDTFRSACLAHGIDELGWVLQNAGAIAEFELRRAAEGGPWLVEARAPSRCVSA